MVLLLVFLAVGVASSLWIKARLEVRVGKLEARTTNVEAGVKHLNADADLDEELWRVLESKGLLPIRSRVHGERP